MRPTTSTAPHTLPGQAWWHQLPPVAAGLMFLAMGSHFVPDGHDDQRMLQWLALTLGALWLFRRPAGITLPVSILSRSLLALFFVLGLISSSLAASPVHGFGETGILLLLLMAALAVAGDMQRRFQPAMIIVWKIAALGCSLYLVQLSVSYGMLLALPLQMSYADFIAGFSNYRFFNHAQTILIPLLVLWCCGSGGTRAGRVASIGVTSLYWALLFATAGRGTMLGLAAGALAVLLVQGKQGLRYLTCLAGTAAFGLALYWLFFHVIPVMLGLSPFTFSSGVMERTLQDPSGSRTHLWLHAWNLIVAHPLLGTGPLHFAHAAAVPLNAAHPHNFILQIASEWGLPALACMCALIARACRSLVCSVRQVNAGDRENIAIGSALVLTGAAILADGQVSGLLVMPVSQMLIALYVGCAIAWVQSRSAAPPVAMAPATVLVIRGALATALLAVTLAITPELPALLKARSGPVTVDSTFVYKPRLWKDGRF